MATSTAVIEAAPSFTYQDFDPRKGEKFSPNLFNFLKKQCGPHGFRKGRFPTIFEGANGDAGFKGHLFIGWQNECGCHPGEVTAARLWGVLGHGNRATLGVWVGGAAFVVVPDFWERYAKIGRCALDPDHEVDFSNADGRYVYNEKKSRRACTWCGHKQRLKTWKETIVKDRKKWIAVTSAAKREG